MRTNLDFMEFFSEKSTNIWLTTTITHNSLPLRPCVVASSRRNVRFASCDQLVSLEVRVLYKLATSFVYLQNLLFPSRFVAQICKEADHRINERGRCSLINESAWGTSPIYKWINTAQWMIEISAFCTNEELFNYATHLKKVLNIVSCHLVP